MIWWFFFINGAIIRFRFVWFWFNEKSYDMQMRIYKIHGMFAIFSKWGDRDQSESKDLSPAVNGIESEPSKNKWQKTPFILATFLHFFTFFSIFHSFWIEIGKRNFRNSCKIKCHHEGVSTYCALKMKSILWRTTCIYEDNNIHIRQLIIKLVWIDFVFL